MHNSSYPTAHNPNSSPGLSLSYHWKSLALPFSLKTTINYVSQNKYSLVQLVGYSTSLDSKNIPVS